MFYYEYWSLASNKASCYGKDSQLGIPKVRLLRPNPPCSSRSSAHWLEKHTNALCQSVLASQRSVCDETFEAVRYIAVSLSEPSLESWRGVCVHCAWKCLKKKDSHLGILDDPAWEFLMNSQLELVEIPMWEL